MTEPQFPVPRPMTADEYLAMPEGDGYVVAARGDAPDVIDAPDFPSVRIALADLFA